MKVLVVGGGGREHAIVKSLKKSPKITQLYAAPGNGGIAGDAVCVDIGATDIDGIVDFCVKEKMDYVVVAPDDPLVLGAVDRLTEKGIPCFGPDGKAAIIEGSKVFSKALMKKYSIPTAEYKALSDMDTALEYVRQAPLPTVIKADGLALGKGVIVAETRAQAEEAVRSIMGDKIFGESGSSIVVEEYLEGPEVSVLCFTDGETVKPMVSSMDHKRALDGDRGLNTGGMGTVAPNPYYTKEIAARCMDEIFLPTVNAMSAECRAFKGCLYFGLMLTDGGPKVIEYNCRFGDPETQVVLPLLKSDLFEIMQSVTEGRLSGTPVEFSDDSACCVIMASDGYPKEYKKGFEISFDGCDAEIYVAGAKKDGDRLLTNGGRVLGVTAVAGTLREAVENAYRATGSVHFENSYKRTDIGKRALEELKED